MFLLVDINPAGFFKQKLDLIRCLWLYILHIILVFLLNLRISYYFNVEIEIEQLVVIV